LQGLFGGSLIKSKWTKNRFKQPYHFTVSGKNAKRLVEETLPYLIEKHKQAELLLELRNNIDGWNATPRRRGNIPEDVQEYRKGLMDQCTKLKKIAVLDLPNDYPQGKNERLAYMAGYLEAEGCFTINKGEGNHFYATVSVHACSRGAMILLEESFGGTTIYRPSKAQNRRPQYLWRVKGSAAADICRACFPYLTFKMEEADLLRTLQNSSDLWAKKVGRNGMPSWLTQKRTEWMMRIRAIHSPGRAETKSEQPRNEVSDSPICNEPKVAGLVTAVAV